ncbi:33813_t:CDS:1 [Racocetra persica]|uniref:33813_t:CDS:1 n=1 Tax=Racocetra persica TaxID=160502 RepID=A0ACA9KFD1_9GLOM|nr:33813_t:CDS:1 [Racocetra persica]
MPQNKKELTSKNFDSHYILDESVNTELNFEKENLEIEPLFQKPIDQYKAIIQEYIYKKKKVPLQKSSRNYDKNKITTNKDQDKIIKKERCVSIMEKAEKFINKVKKILKESKIKVQIPTDIKKPLYTMCNY